MNKWRVNHKALSVPSIEVEKEAPAEPNGADSPDVLNTETLCVAGFKSYT